MTRLRSERVLSYERLNERRGASVGSKPWGPAAVRAAARGGAAKLRGASRPWRHHRLETRQGRTRRFASIRWWRLPPTRDSSCPYVAESGQIPPHTDWTNGKKTDQELRLRSARKSKRTKCNDTTTTKHQLFASYKSRMGCALISMRLPVQIVASSRQALGPCAHSITGFPVRPRPFALAAGGRWAARPWLWPLLS